MHQDSRENDSEPAAREERIGPTYGPRRRAPRYYIGETYGAKRAQHHDVERNKNGSLPGIRNKAARRVIRTAFKRRNSSIERALQLPRAMKAQAREVISDEHYDKSPTAQSKKARRLFEAELAIHKPVCVPTGPELRAMRTEARKAKRAGKLTGANDAIDQLVDRMQK